MSASAGPSGAPPAPSPASPAPTPPSTRHPIYGTTVYIGRSQVETVSGVFTVLTYQDLIHKGYILALVKGDLERDGNGVVYTRLHSSCVTSGKRVEEEREGERERVE